jgi:hypothetical protein
MRSWTREEADAQEAFIENMLLERPDYTEDKRAEVVREKFGIGKGRLRTLTERVRSRWEKDDSKLRMQRKAEQARRLLRHMSKAQGQRDRQGNWVEKPNWSAVAKFEALYADLCGTREAIKIDIDVRMSEALTMVIAQMTPEQVQEQLERYNEDVRLADEYRKRVVIDVAAE